MSQLNAKKLPVKIISKEESDSEEEEEEEDVEE